ncbi:PilW family protein [Legionella shakespearei]|uniref:Type IV fimbrial biogenesis PilW-like protein n=1 Tax=Legionella shakespearei DSM 23087 TaxID=1122169 RepID=A0A0W0YHH5_9GAMM|nr:PilW family protein [Legionella shakespearei]KTD56417.1 type IV fimbrial biogenesis PilW-like protein [Legionella shakespearei DSM 23087]
MNYYGQYQKGFSMVELMVASLIGLIISYAVLQIYLAQSKLYKTSSSQDLIQSSENAISNLISPIIRSAGFTGCGSISTAVSNLNVGGPAPLGTLNTNPTLIMGYNGSGTSYTLTQNPANSTNAASWTPSLETTLVGNVAPGSDVVIVFGSSPGSTPLAITTIDSGSNALTVQSITGATIASGQYAGVSDCVKTVIFQVTGVAGTTITHNSGGGILQNTSSSFPVSFQVGSQFVRMQQTAFFVAQGQGGQSSLMRATLTNGAWNIEQLVPGVEIMKVQYGIGTSGTITRYVSANAVTNWSQVYAVRLGFLIAGQPGSGTLNTGAYTVLDTQVTVPDDNRLRHVFEITIHLRNALS